ncbi:hypothetical protein LOC67_17640 [Stieleria sp. JC731]|uniref:hypothetical protein n=1 Tax=Pirellulaceae TaxID=2691357 RepID=UPI001E54E633|nr:hypothetical protein [Stieleria sp. JC731]MCC9602376.1 hypothetical protein [Stieleria sp. JC731]
MRLPVILVQNPPAAGSAVAEALVASLIGYPGLDLTLVDRFDSLGPESTDRMTLAGITVPAAVLDWRLPEELIETLRSIDFDGYRCAHRLDPEANDQSITHRRRLFLFDLQQHRDAEVIVNELDRLRQSLSVKTVSLGGIGGPGRRTETSSEVSSAVATESTSVGAVERRPDSESSTAHPRINLGSDPSDDTLDELLDQLDDLDV